MNRSFDMRLLQDGKRLYLHDGPIDLIIEAYGSQLQTRLAYEAAAARFCNLLHDLCKELAQLRSPVTTSDCNFCHPVTRRMHAAVLPYAKANFITPMAAVAGSVAEEILGAMVAAASIDRAYVNNGGDIAIYLTPGTQFRVGLVDRPDQPTIFGSTTIHSDECVRGIATSGWRGRSFSLGIADAVTVLANTASQADAAATIIGNAVDLPGHPAVTRTAANSLQCDSDLGGLPVTTQVGPLSASEVGEAIESGLQVARSLIEKNLICGAAIRLQGDVAVVNLGREPDPHESRNLVTGVQRSSDRCLSL